MCSRGYVECSGDGRGGDGNNVVIVATIHDEFHSYSNSKSNSNFSNNKYKPFATLQFHYHYNTPQCCRFSPLLCSFPGMSRGMRGVYNGNNQVNDYYRRTLCFVNFDRSQITHLDQIQFRQNSIHSVEWQHFNVGQTI